MFKASLRGELAVCGLLIGVACLAACPSQPPCCEPEPQSDAGSPPDSGVSSDAGATSDAGTLEDGGAPDAGPVDAGSPADAGTATDGGILLRVVASNLSSGPNQSYDPGEGVRILKGLRPDVALIQEMNYGQNTDAELRAFVDAAFGPEFSYYRETGATIPNGVVSRYPILESGEWKDPQTNTRDFAYARIDIPGPVDLWAVSVHLLTSNAGSRMSQATSLLSRLQALPPGDYVVLGGDFNTDNRGEACLTTLGSYFRTTAPFPVDQAGNGNTNSSRGKPYDWVMADAELDVLSTAVKIGERTFPSGFVLDSRVYSPLSDVAPVQAGDSAATNMQHMGVVRDFRIP